MPTQLDISLSKEKVDELVSARISDEKKIRSQLVTPEQINKPEAYKRLRDQDKKQQFRDKLVQRLHQSWHMKTDLKTADHLKNQFLEMTQQVSRDGAIIFGDLIPKSSFQNLVQSYDELLAKYGNESWIHSYVNLANHPEYLTNADFNHAFLHPLLISLISYYVGGPIRIVDARAKDAKPLSIKAQDNMLHIDNTPFNDEFKTIVTWERSKASAPKGQYFVFIPGTHKAVRQCFVNDSGSAWSSENASIFIRPEEVQNVFELQKQLLKIESPSVVEAKHDERPLTTVFAAGSLVHHRYRTEEGRSRSCMILAFHRAEDNPGQFMEPKIVSQYFAKENLNSFLFGYQGNSTPEEAFLNALIKNSAEIAAKINQIKDEDHSTEIIQHHARELSQEQLSVWKKQVTAAPTVEDKKIKELHFPLGKTLENEEFVSFLGGRMMMFDKHGPLDLILYEDSHEEIRKWARNRIREMKLPHLQKQLEQWAHLIEQPSETDLLTPNQLLLHTKELVHYIDQLPSSEKLAGTLSSDETLSATDAFRSLRQLIEDLGEAIIRCESRQAFLSTSLFIFWAVDELINLHPHSINSVASIGGALLKNYVATAILIEKQMSHELLSKPTSTNRSNDSDKASLPRNLSFFNSSEKNVGVELSQNAPSGLYERRSSL